MAREDPLWIAGQMLGFGLFATIHGLPLVPSS